MENFERPPQFISKQENPNTEMPAKKTGGIIRNFIEKKSLRKRQEEIEFQEMTYGDYDSEFWHFGAYFVECLPEEYKLKGGTDGFKSYIENTLSQGKIANEEKNKLTAVEFGGPGSKFFRGFSNDFFKKTVGGCLADIRGTKIEDSRLNHYVVAGDVLGAESNKTLNEVKVTLETNKVDLIISRMQGALNKMNIIFLLDNAVKEWYNLLNENGIMFIQYCYAHSVDKREDNVTRKCIEFIKEKYPELDIQQGPGVMRLHKNLNAPEQLPKDTRFFT